MSDKKYIIPKNCYTQFELIPNVGWKEMLFFLPSIVFDIPFAYFVPVTVTVKIFIIVFTLFIPFLLVFLRPIREDIPAWMMILWKIQFSNRQKTFLYRKEVLSNEIIHKEKESHSSILSRQSAHSGN